MAKQPQDRPAHAGLLADALRACTSGATVPVSRGCSAPKLAPRAAMDVRLELERLRRLASGGHYEFLGVERDASAQEIDSAIATMERRLDKIDPALDGGLAVVVAGLRQRLASARQTLGGPHSRAWHDALLGNFRGVARCLDAGLTSARLEVMNRTWSERCPERASKAQSLAAVAEIHLRGRDHARALDCLQRALEVAPLSVDLHRRYRALTDDAAQKLSRAG
jgi:serine/threonine-protein kinase